jgi:hypothetical protein
MPSTYTLISSNVLASSAASVTFSSIPATYTDLVLRISARQDGASNGGRLTLRFNGDSATNYSRLGVAASGASVGNISNSSATYFRAADADADNDTANTFSSAEIYIPNYTATTSRPISNFGVAENNSTTATGPTIIAGLYRGASAITSIVINDEISSWNFVSGSSFYLYGIKNS